MSCFGSLLEATRPEKDLDQVGKGPSGHLLLTELDVDFERFTEIGNRFVQVFETSLRHRKVRQQVSLICIKDALLRQGRLEILASALKCRCFQCALACQRQPTD